MSSRSTNLHYYSSNNGKSFTASAPKSLWGELFSFLKQKSASKSQNPLFRLLFRPMGSYSPPPPSLATLLNNANKRLYIVQPKGHKVAVRTEREVSIKFYLKRQCEVATACGRQVGKYGPHTDCHSGIRIDKSHCFFVKQAVHPCW